MTWHRAATLPMPSERMCRQGTAATASPNMIIASRNMTAAEIKKLTIGCILVEHVFSTHNEEGIDWIHCLKGQVFDLGYCNT
jgi:hypothetical protein